ncbi:MAG: Hsp20/alpha crystallin family protein [SAR202 cluster bacterium]|nr:Hsp20/alpha crystallin family protein [SAR202 cluster bacterium]
MVLQRWAPFTDTRRFEFALNRLWRDEGVRNGESTSWRLPLDVAQDADNIVVKATVPGFNPEDIKAGIENKVLTINAESPSEAQGEETEYLLRERRTGSYQRSIRLPDTVDADKAESTYDNGILTITVPKQEEKKARQIEIKVA